jgi:hypothetical protein
LDVIIHLISLASHLWQDISIGTLKLQQYEPNAHLKIFCNTPLPELRNPRKEYHFLSSKCPAIALDNALKAIRTSFSFNIFKNWLINARISKSDTTDKSGANLFS